MTVTSQQHSDSTGDFFIPDLCAARPVFFAVLVSELLVLIFVLASSALPAFNWGLLAGTSLFNLWVVLVSIALLCLLRGKLNQLELPSASALAMAVVGLVTLLTSLLALRMFPLAHSASDSMWVLRNMLVALVLAGIVLRYFFLQQQLRLRERSEMQARLDALQARMRPHFLFNTMNSIASLIASRPEDAEQVVEDLSELFRASLREQEQSTVGDELKLCDLYLRIEQVRLGPRLQIERQVEQNLEGLPMPSLILQPLVENAIYHGISKIADGGVVQLNLKRQQDSLYARVVNPRPQTGSSGGGHRMALDTIRQRLAGLYGDRARLDARGEGPVYEVELVYPLVEESL